LKFQLAHLLISRKVANYTYAFVYHLQFIVFTEHMFWCSVAWKQVTS